MFVEQCVSTTWYPSCPLAGGESGFCGRRGAERRYPVDTRVESNSSPEMHVLEMHFEVHVLGCGGQIKYWVS